MAVLCLPSVRERQKFFLFFCDQFNSEFQPLTGGGGGGGGEGVHENPLTDH